MKMLTILLCSMLSLWIGILTSVLGSLVVVFLLFIIFRPRFIVRDEIAITKDGKLIFCFKNKSIFPCMNIRVSVKRIREAANADEMEDELKLAHTDIAYMSGRWGKENDSEIGVYSAKAEDPIEPHLRIVISAQHAVSGLSGVAIHNYVASDAKKGKFEKGLFVPKGSNYARVYIRQHLKIFRRVFWTSVVLVAIMTVLFGVFVSSNWIYICFCYMLLNIFAFMCLTIWHCYIQTRANAFSSMSFAQTINLMMLAIKQGEAKIPEAEDTELEEVRENN